MRRSAINTLIGETIVVKKEVKKESDEEEEEPEFVVSDRHTGTNGSRGIKRSPTQSDEIDTSKYLEMVSVIFSQFDQRINPLQSTGTVHKLWQHRYLSDSVSINSC